MKLHQRRHYLKFNKIYSLDKLASFCYNESKNKGFHSKQEDLTDAEISNYLMNIHAEISELWEAYRKRNLRGDCDKANGMENLGLDKLSCIEEELADILIRVCDMAKAFDIKLSKAVFVKLMYNRVRPFRNGNKLT